jgi:signal transduction histidine kinase
MKFFSKPQWLDRLTVALALMLLYFGLTKLAHLFPFYSSIGSSGMILWAIASLVVSAIVTKYHQTCRELQTLKTEQLKLETQLEQIQSQFKQALQDLSCSQARLIQAEKMAGLGQLVAGVAHEVNNPISFVWGNLSYAQHGLQDLIRILHLYQQYLPQPPTLLQKELVEADLEHLLTDLPSLFDSLQLGVERIREITTALRNFSRTDCNKKQLADIHQGMDTTLQILQHRLKATCHRPAIRLLKKYGKLPQVECHIGQLNQVFMNVIANAIDALDEYSHDRTYDELEREVNTIEIRTDITEDGQILIAIYNSGPSIPEEVQRRIFDTFYTTKPAGKGTGLGLSISRQIIVDTHQGQLKCISIPSWGTEFVILIPMQRQLISVG